MKQLTHENNFVYLCVSLIVLLFSASLVQVFSNTWGEDFFSLIMLAMLIVGIKSLNTEITWQRIVYILIVLLAVVNIGGKIFNIPYMGYINLSILFIFFTGSFWKAYKQILFEGKVDSNKMIGSLSLYLLLGLMWTMIYLFLFEMDPTAFSGIEAGTWKQNFSQMAYYSFVTLTTLGYGDILPVNKVAQFFVFMEAIIGVFYMAIIVSSLISLRLASLDSKE